MSLDVSDERVLARLRQAFRLLNRWMVVMWRLGLGRWAEVWPAVGGRILVLEHVGRSSGAQFRTPLNFTPSAGSVTCVAAFGRETDWYRNVMARPEVTLWLPSGAWHASATDISDTPDRIDRLRSVLLDSGLAAPTFGIFPARMSDEELDAATSEYRLVRFDLVGPSDADPADLRWAWGVVAMSIVVLVVARRRWRRAG